MDSCQIQKFAKVLVDYSMDIKAKDKLCIQAHIPSLPLVKEVYKLAVQKGAYPYVDIVIDELNELYCLHASDEQLQYVSSLQEFKVQHCDAFLIILGSENTNAMAEVDPKKIAMRTLSRKKVNEIYMKRISDGSLKLCITQFPNHSLAQAAGMSLNGYREFLSNACFLNAENPVALWQEYSARQEKICSFLKARKNFRFVSQGTDLRFSAEGRNWINCDGRINFPDGEVFTGPIENSVNGEITFSFPAVYQGQEVRGVYLKFQDGKVVDFDAKHGKKTLESMLDTDEGARYAGEIAIATNYNITKFTKNILFDEKIGGTIHLAIGSSIPSSGGVNKSAVHWDMVCDMRSGEIYADDDLIYKDGKFIVNFD